MSNSFGIDESELQRFSALQAELNFTRNVDGIFEPVDYYSGGLRFWINDESRSYEPHWHPAVEIVSVLECEYSVEVDGKTYLLAPGDILLIPSGLLHKLSAPESGRRLIYLAEFSRFSDLEGFNFVSSLFIKPVLLNETTSPDIIGEERIRIANMLREYYSPDVFREMAVFSLLLDFVVTLLRHRPQASPAASVLANPDDSDQSNLRKHIIPVLNYIDKNYAEEISLEKAAEIAGFSKYYFSRMFKDCTGFTFTDYLCVHRVKVAAELLAESNVSVTEIAQLTGFPSLPTFNRIFKFRKGYTPTQYRRLFSAS